MTWIILTSSSFHAWCLFLFHFAFYIRSAELWSSHWSFKSSCSFPITKGTVLNQATAFYPQIYDSFKFSDNRRIHPSTIKLLLCAWEVAERVNKNAIFEAGPLTLQVMCGHGSDFLSLSFSFFTPTMDWGDN